MKTCAYPGCTTAVPKRKTGLCKMHVHTPGLCPCHVCKAHQEKVEREARKMEMVRCYKVRSPWFEDGTDRNVLTTISLPREPWV